MMHPELIPNPRFGPILDSTIYVACRRAPETDLGPILSFFSSLDPFFEFRHKEIEDNVFQKSGLSADRAPLPSVLGCVLRTIV